MFERACSCIKHCEKGFVRVCVCVVCWIKHVCAFIITKMFVWESMSVWARVCSIWPFECFVLANKMPCMSVSPSVCVWVTVSKKGCAYQRISAWLEREAYIILLRVCVPHIMHGGVLWCVWLLKRSDRRVCCFCVGLQAWQKLLFGVDEDLQTLPCDFNSCMWVFACTHVLAAYTYMYMRASDAYAHTHTHTWVHWMPWCIHARMHTYVNTPTCTHICMQG